MKVIHSADRATPVPAFLEFLAKASSFFGLGVRMPVRKSGQIRGLKAIQTQEMSAFEDIAAPTRFIKYPSGPNE